MMRRNYDAQNDRAGYRSGEPTLPLHRITPAHHEASCPYVTMNSALDKLYSELLNEAEKEEPEEITDAERAKRFLEEKQVTIDKLREVRNDPFLKDKGASRRVLTLKDAFRRKALSHTKES